MPDINTLASRIDAEFTAVEEKVKGFQVEQMETHKQRQQRLEQLGKVFDQLRDIWRPRLELLVKKFEGRVQATPRIVPSTREATFDFQSHLAHVRLKLSAFTDRDIQKLILSYDLRTIPTCGNGRIAAWNAAPSRCRLDTHGRDRRGAEWLP
jgi:hypothetical protein